MLRALSKGFMPSTEQVIINLRTLLASDVLNPETPGLSDSGRRLLKLSKQWLTEFIELLRNKNDGDQIQDFIWFLLHARISVDVQDIARTATKTRAKADASAGKDIHVDRYVHTILTVKSIPEHQDSRKSASHKFRLQDLPIRLKHYRQAGLC